MGNDPTCPNVGCDGVSSPIGSHPVALGSRPLVSVATLSTTTIPPQFGTIYILNSAFRLTILRDPSHRLVPTLFVHNSLCTSTFLASILDPFLYKFPQRFRVWFYNAKSNSQLQTTVHFLNLILCYSTTLAA